MVLALLKKKNMLNLCFSLADEFRAKGELNFLYVVLFLYYFIENLLNCFA